MTTLLNRLYSTGDGDDLHSVTIGGTGSNRALIILVMAKTQGSGGANLTAATFDGTAMTIISENIQSYGNFAILYMPEADLPGSGGAYNISTSYDASAQETTYAVYELTDAPQASTNFELILTDESQGETNGVVADTPHAISSTLTDSSGTFAIPFIAAADTSYFDPSMASLSANMGSQNFQDTTYAMMFSYEDASVSGTNEVYTGTYTHGRSGNAPDCFFYGVLGIKGVANVDPVAPDETYSITTAAVDNDVIATYVATDSDGTIASYSITGSVLAIHTTTGVITLIDDSGLVAGTPITATVTATDNDSGTDTGLVTVNVTAVLPVITGSVGNVAGGTTTLTLSTLSTAGRTLTITRGGISVTNIQILSTTVVSYLEPAEGLLLGVNSDIVVDYTDGTAVTSDAFSAIYNPALGAVIALTVAYGDLPVDSFLAGVTAYAGLVIGDQIEYTPIVDPSGNTISISGTGVYTVTNASLLVLTQSFDFALIDVSDTFDRSNVSTVSINVPATTLNTSTITLANWSAGSGGIVRGNDKTGGL